MNIKKVQMILILVSQERHSILAENCIRHHLFRDPAFDLHYAKGKDLTPLLASIMGLFRGYALPEIGQLKRTSPLLMEDFVDES